MLCKCADCGKDVPHGCKRCMECSKKALKAAFVKSPELKQAFKETVDEMRRPENIEKMAREITSTVQAVAVLQQALKSGGEPNAL